MWLSVHCMHTALASRDAVELDPRFLADVDGWVERELPCPTAAAAVAAA